jgi:VWFA-related protein
MLSRIALVLLATLTPPLLGQGDSSKATFRAQSNLVLLPTRVQTKNGETLYGLKPEEFILEDNGIRQAIHVDEDSDETAGPSGLSLVVALQCSRSADLEFGKIAGLATMIEQIAGASPHEVAVLSYGDGPTLLGDFSSSPDALRFALSKLKACHDYGAASLDTVNFATHLLEHRKNHYRRAILLIGETRDHGSRSRLSEVVASLGVTNTVIYSVAFSPNRDETIASLRSGNDEPVAPQPPLSPPPPSVESSSTLGDVAAQARAAKPPPLVQLPPQLLLIVNALRQNAASELASLSGGEYINFTTQKGFDRGLQRLSNHVHNYYLLSFQPSATANLGLHTLRVRVPDYPDAVIQTRASYWYGNLETPPSGGR